MDFMAFTIWVSLRLDRTGPFYPCNPLQSVKSVVKNVAATISIFLFSTRTRMCHDWDPWFPQPLEPAGTHGRHRVQESSNKISVGAGTKLDNLIAAITGGAGIGTGAGTLYGTGTVTHALATAAVAAGDTLLATALSYGVAGNAIASTATLANGSWAATTLLGGLAGTAPSYLGQDCLVGTTACYKAISLTPPIWIGP